MKLKKGVFEGGHVRFERIAESYHIILVEWTHDKDHIHNMFKA